MHESLNESYRLGSSSWKIILKDIKEFGDRPGGWEVNMKNGTATQYFYNEGEEERKIVLSNPDDNDIILVELLDDNDNILDDNRWDAEGLSADEISSDAFRQVDCDL